jgi:alpha-ribazole phosphatase
MKVALIRHPAPLIEPGLCYGRLDIPTAPSAQAQIREIAADPRLQGATRVWSSPALRCRGLAEAIAHALSVPLTIDPRLSELDFGAWEGQPWDAISRQDLDRWAASPMTFAPPGGESGAALFARVRDICTDLRQARQDCVVVSHGGPLKLLAPLLQGQSPNLLAAPPALASVTYLQCQP